MQFTQAFLCPVIVGIQKSDKCATCVFDAQIARRIRALPFLVQDRHPPRVFSRQSGEKIAGAIGRAVVNHDQFDIAVVLAKRAAHRVLDECRAVEAGHDDGDQRAVPLLTVHAFINHFNCMAIHRHIKLSGEVRIGIKNRLHVFGPYDLGTGTAVCCFGVPVYVPLVIPRKA